MSRYKVFASPFAKVFLGAVFTYQVIYWTWVKLEMEEVKVKKNRVFHLQLYVLLKLTVFVRATRCLGDGGKGADRDWEEVNW
jgi:hypothetical protein